MSVLEHSPISSSPGILGGAIVFTGTRVHAQTLLDYMIDGFTLDEFLEYFPSVTRVDAASFLGALDETHHWVDDEEVLRRSQELDSGAVSGMSREEFSRACGH